MKRFPFIVGFLMTTVAFLSVAAAADEGFNAVKPRNFDPYQTRLVNASWVGGIGCPTNAKVRLFDSNPPYSLLPASRYTDPACTTGDSRDKNNEGLLMAKTGPTLNDASAVADLVGVKGTVLTELGYDIRKPGSDGSGGARGSHCGAGAPRFDITLQGDSNIYFLGCNSPPASQTPGDGFIRLRWGDGTTLNAYQNGVTPTNISGKTVKSISIVFDEGYDAALGGPDNFGLAVLDNIDVNTTLVGKGGGGGGDNSGDLSNQGGDGGGGPSGGGHGGGGNQQGN